MADFVDQFNAPAPGGGDGTDPLDRISWPLTDLYNGKRFAAALKGNVMFVPGRGWAVWRGACFDFEGGAEDALGRGAVVSEWISAEAAVLDRRPVSREAVTRKMAALGTEDAATAERRIRSERNKEYLRAAKAAQGMTKLRSARDLAAPHLRCTVTDLDTAPDLLQFPNGTLDLGRVIEEGAAAMEGGRADPAAWQRALHKSFDPEPRREHRPTRTCGTAFDPSAKAPGWSAFLRLAFPERDTRAYAKRCLGLLPGGQRNETAIILLGKGGNGKSTVIKAVELALGGYAKACRIEMFCEQRGGANGHTAEEAVLPGARVYVATEPDMQVTLAASKIKGLTGGDLRLASAKGLPPFEWRPAGIPLLSANKMPRVNDPSEGFWRRINPILFQQSLHELPPDQRMSSAAVERMLQAERAGIVNWLLQGWVTVQLRGLNPPAAVSVLKSDLRGLADPVGQFLEERCTLGAGLRVKTPKLYEAFKAWVEQAGDKPMGGRAFSSSMIARDFTRVKSNDWYWEGIELAALEGDPDGSDMDPENF